MLRIPFLIVCLTLAVVGYTQSNVHGETDTLSLHSDTKPHSPTKATLYSMAVPGLGQAYNKKYWKIPIIYAGIGIPLYYAIQENNEYQDFKSAFINRQAGDSSDAYLDPNNFFDNDALLQAIDISRRNRNLLIIVSSVVYIMNIIDARIDAHLYHFDVSDDLSLRLSPDLQFNHTNLAFEPTFKLSLRFH